MATRIILTYSSKAFDFTQPYPKMVCIEDIAHALACTNRYGGHTRVPYSVAEHCVRMSHLTVGHPLINLLHDSAEAYIGDIPGPYKKGLGWVDLNLTYADAEFRILHVIGCALGVEDLFVEVDYKETKEADLIMLATEVRDLMPECPPELYAWSEWISGIKADPHKIEPWTWDKAKVEYLKRFKELTA